MKLKVLLFLCFIFSLQAEVFGQNVMIYEIYGGGGNAGSIYKNDYIVLYNPTNSAVNLSTWSVQYASAAGNSWSKTNLSGSIPAFGFYLIQQAQGAGGTDNLPTPDATGTITMAGTAGKVILVNSTTIATTVTCPTADLVDQVSYGTTATDCGEGRTPAPSNTTGVRRNTYTNGTNHATDFSSFTANTLNAPKNSLSPVVNNNPNLTILNAVSNPNPITSGNVVNYWFEVKNNGGANATTPDVKLTFPVNFTFTTVNTNYTAGTTSLNLTTLAASQSVFVTITGNITAAGTNALFISADNANTITESSETDNNLELFVTANAPATPNLQILNTNFNPNPVLIGGTLKYGFEIKNNGTANATTPDVKLIFPANFTFTTANTNYTAGTTSLNLTTLAANQSLFITITGNITAAGAAKLFISADQANVIVENNETDNNVEIAATVIPNAKIWEIQGTGTAATVGTYRIEAIVTGIFNQTGGLGGFYVQEEDADSDNNANTSDAIFITSNFTVALGDKVQIIGTSQENGANPSFNQAVIIPSSITIVSNGNVLPTAVSVSLPMANATDFEKYEGMRMTLNQSLTVSTVDNLVKFGEIVVSNGRIMQPTSITNPGTDANNLNAANNLNKLIVDDGRNGSFLSPFVNNFNALNPIRTGQKITNIQGIMGYGFSAYRLQPTVTLTFTNDNSRTTNPPSVGNATLKVAGVNVLNYFNGDGLGGGYPTTRGADNANEFVRQRDKTIQVMTKLNADIFGIMEMENDGYGTNSALQDLVNGLNAVAGAGTYAFIDADANIGAANALGTDLIKVAMIYKPAKVTPIGTTATLNNVAPFNVNTRPTLTQAFQDPVSGEKFIISANHFKSKVCGGSSGANTDQNDGQSCWNATRVQGTTALLNWLNTNPTGTGVNRILILGDLNANAKEDPITLIKNAGYTDLINAYGGNSAYSYSFDGQAGYLDHALANSFMSANISGTADWHINADEVEFLDYNVENLQTMPLVTKPANFYTADQYRASDHDPVLIGLNFTPNIIVAQTNNIAHNSSYDFGNIDINANLTKTFTITNNGNITLNLTSFQLNGANAAEFSTVSWANNFLSAGQNQTFQIRFSPTSAGAKTATLSIGNNSANNPFSFTLEGNKPVIVPTPNNPANTGGNSLPNVNPATVNVILNGQTLTLSNTQITTLVGEFEIDKPITLNGLILRNLQGNAGYIVGAIIPNALGEQEISLFDQNGNAFKIKLKVIKQAKTLLASQISALPETAWNTPAFTPNFGNANLAWEIIGGNASKTADGKIQLSKFIGDVQIRVWLPETDKTTVSNSVIMFLRLGKANQSISFLPIQNRTFGDQNFALNATASSSLPITYEVLEGKDLVEITNGNLRILKAGFSRIRAIQNGDEFYMPASPIDQTLFINRKAQTISYNQVPNLTFSNNPNTDGININASANSGLVVKFSVFPADMAEIQSNRMIPRKAGYFTLVVSQEGNEQFEPAQTVYQYQIAVRPNLSLSNVNLSADGETLTVDYQAIGTNQVTLWLVNRSFTPTAIFELGTQNASTGKFVVQMPNFIEKSDKYEVKIVSNLPVSAESALKAVPPMVYPKPLPPFLRKVQTQICAELGNLTDYKIDWYVNGRFFRTSTNQNCIEISAFFGQGGRTEAETVEIYAIVQFGTRRSTASSTIEVEKQNIVTANQESDLAGQILVYPNPSKGDFRLQLDQKFERATVRIFDAQGKEIWEKSYANLLKINELIDLGKKPAGVYYLRLETEKGSLVRKITVE